MNLIAWVLLFAAIFHFLGIWGVIIVCALLVLSSH